MTRLRDADKHAALVAWQGRRRQHEDDKAREFDNTALPAGSPLYFTCHACFGWVVLAEDYLTGQALCYDCRDLADKGWIVEQLDGAWVNR